MRLPQIVDRCGFFLVFIQMLIETFSDKRKRNVSLFQLDSLTKLNEIVDSQQNSLFNGVKKVWKLIFGEHDAS